MLGDSSIDLQPVKLMKKDEKWGAHSTGVSSQKIGEKALKIIKKIVPKDVGVKRSLILILSSPGSFKTGSNQGDDYIGNILPPYEKS